LLREIITFKSIFNKITAILTGSEFTDQSSILSIPDRILGIIKNTIIYFTLFNDPFAGLAAQIAQLYIWWHKGLKRISPREVGMQPTQQWWARVRALFESIVFY
jgi:hypothetical protein